MALVVANVGEVEMLEKILNQNLSLRLYSNNVTPTQSDVAGTYVEVAGGGYAAKTLAFATWGITQGNPTIALYGAAQDFVFTGATSAPGVIYGYYVLDAAGVLLWAERFPAANVPFTPQNLSLIRITPRLTLDNA